MANTKISALPLASTPLAGTEVLPIVQGGITEQVATNDLTVRNVRANATTGILQVTGPAAATTRVMTTPNANFTVARTDAAQSFTGDQTLSTGNLIQGTAGKGFNFTANTPAAGMTSELLNWYEEGTWTPTATATIPGITPPIITSTSGTYTRIGRTVYITYNVLFGVNGTGAGQVLLTGLPFTPSQRGFGAGQETDVVGFNTLCQTVASTDATYIGKTDTTYPGGTAYRLIGNFSFIV